MQAENRPQDQGTSTARGGFQGRRRGRGGGASRGSGQIICYNCGKAGHFELDYQNPMHPSCQYCKQFDHVIEDCPMLIAKMQEKKTQQPMQNIQMMTAEPRKEDHKLIL